MGSDGARLHCPTFDAYLHRELNEVEHVQLVKHLEGLESGPSVYFGWASLSPYRYHKGKNGDVHLICYN